MPFDLTTHRHVLIEVLMLHGRVLARDGLAFRPDFASKAVASRLRAGLRALAAFLRRMLILMALEMEPDLVHVERRETLARATAQKVRVLTPRFLVYPAHQNGYQNGKLPDFGKLTKEPEYDWWGLDDPWSTSEHNACRPPARVPLGHLFDQLEHLCAIAKDPLAKARRLAFSLGRTRHGPLDPPRETIVMRHWGREASTYYDAMGFEIEETSHTRPPPLPPPRPRRKPQPTLTML